MQRRLIWDEEEVERFVEYYLPELKEDEVFFTSLSARNKYLTEKERVDLHLGRTEMFSRMLVRSKEKFLRTLRRYECDEEAYLTKNGRPIPEKCIVCYVNLNPSSSLKATQEVVTEINNRIFDSALSEGKVPETLSSLKKLDLIVMNAFQRNGGTKKYIDIDFDVPKEQEFLKVFSNCLDVLSYKGLKYFVVDTKSGFHVVIDRSSIKYNYTEDINNFDNAFKRGAPEVKTEVIVNKNLMIPVPGTLQAGYKVCIREDLSHWNTGE